MSNQILCVGSVAYDSIQTPFGRVNKTLGGSATYFSLASSLFAPTMVVGVVGSDFNPPAGGFDVFKKHKIDISGIEKAKGKTFHWAGKYHFDLNTRDTLKTNLGVFANFKPKLNEHHKNANYIFLGNIQPKLQLDVLKQVKQPQFVGLDTMNLWIETARKDLLNVIGKINLLVINDSEARQLTKEHNLLKAAKIILGMMRSKNRRRSSGAAPEDRLLKPILIIKQGEHGLLVFSYGYSHHYGLPLFNLPGYPLEDVVDPTGAGDSFAGALMGYLAKTDALSPTNLKKACAIASTVASFCVEGFGVSKLDKIKISDVNKRLSEYRKLVNF